MAELKQVHAIHDKATLDLLRRAYNDFCRHAGIHAKPVHPGQDKPRPRRGREMIVAPSSNR